MDESQLFNQVTGQLARWGRRRFWSDAALWLPRGLLAGLIAAAIVAALARFRPILHNREVALVALAMALLGLVLSLSALILRKRSLLEQARFFDRRFGLKERTSAAVEIQAGELQATPVMAREQLADTVTAAGRVDAAFLLPIRPRRIDVIMVFLACTLLCLAVFLPNKQATVLAEQQAISAAIADQIAALQALEQRIQEDPQLDEASREALTAPVSRALNELAAGELSREEAVAVLSEAEADLRELSESGNSEGIANALQAAGQSLAADPLTAVMGRALSSGDLVQAAAAAGQLADNVGQLSSTEQEALAQSLAETAAALADVDPALSAQLAQAALDLQRGDIDSAQQALRAAAATLQQRALEQAAAYQAQAAAGQLQSAREQVASAGASPGDSSSAGSGAGQGQADQGSSGEPGVTPGTGQGAGTAAEEGQGAGGPGPGGGHADTVFVPDYVDLSGESGSQIELPAECLANPESCGALISESPTEFGDEQSLVPYRQVFGDYRDAAFEALDSDYVPLGMKGLVRDYFSSLEP